MNTRNYQRGDDVAIAHHGYPTFFGEGGQYASAEAFVAKLRDAHPLLRNNEGSIVVVNSDHQMQFDQQLLKPVLRDCMLLKPLAAPKSLPQMSPSLLSPPRSESSISLPSSSGGEQVRRDEFERLVKRQKQIEGALAMLGAALPPEAN